MGKINQKDIVIVDLDPTSGHEQSGKRPAVIISGDAFHVSGMCFVCPLSSKIKNYFGDVILTPTDKNGLTEKSEILVGQMRAVDQKRVIKKLGKITEKELFEVLRGINYLCENF